MEYINTLCDCVTVCAATREVRCASYILHTIIASASFRCIRNATHCLHLSTRYPAAAGRGRLDKMNNKVPNNGHKVLSAQSMAFLEEVITQEDRSRRHHYKSPPKRARNPILGERTPRSTAREHEKATLLNAQLDHTRKQASMTPTRAGRLRAAARARQASGVEQKTQPSARSSARVSTRDSARSIAKSSAHQSRGPTARSARSARDTGSARPSSRSVPSAQLSSRHAGSVSPEQLQTKKQCEARKAWLQRQLDEVEEQLATLPSGS